MPDCSKCPAFKTTRDAFKIARDSLPRGLRGFARDDVDPSDLTDPDEGGFKDITVPREAMVAVSKFLSDKVSRGDLLRVVKMLHGDPSDDDDGVEMPPRGGKAMDAAARQMAYDRREDAVSGFNKRYPEAANIKVL